jgi:hypothetical protein
MAQGHFPLAAAQSGEPPRLLVTHPLAQMLPRRGELASGALPARLALAGKTIEEASRLIIAERQSHAK